MRRFLVRLYPARWRLRYGEEFALVLEDRPLGPFDVADVLLGALDAHLHLRGDRAASDHGKGFAMTLRLGGYAAIVGGLLWFITLAGNAMHAGADPGGFWIGLVLIGAVVMTLVALVGLSAFQARRDPVLSWAAFAVPAIGAIVALVGSIAMAITGDSDRVIVAGLSSWIVSTIGVLALLLGSALFAIGTWRARSLSRRAAAVLAAGAVLVVFSLTGVSGGGWSSEIVGVTLIVSIVAFPAGWAGLGISALRIDRAAMARLEGAPA